MVNARKKGSRSELKAVKELEADGWLVHRVKGSSKWNKNVDMFSLFDLCAKKDSVTLWIQVKTNKKPPLDKYSKFKEEYCCEYENVEVWVYTDRKGVKKYLC